MNVELIAQTMMFGNSAITANAPEASCDALAEFAGRSCYQSFHKPNPATATNATYLAHTNEQGHFSILEHASATFYVQGVSRALTHELVRHRHLSFSQLSQRFVNESDRELLVAPPAIRAASSKAQFRLTALLLEVEKATQEAYGEACDIFEGEGLPRKKAREAARCFLPNATETKIVVTGNMRAWRDFLLKRWSLHADAEIMQFAGEILKNLRVIAPNSFADIQETPYS